MNNIRPNFEKMELIPVIVQDYETKEILMLAYANEEAYEYMIENKQTCFFSRARKKQWIKGESSGNYQYIKNMYLDCDEDTLLVQVEQIGNACHTGSYSCFFNTITENLNDNCAKGKCKTTLEKIYDKINDRRNNPIEKSYTNYLLDEGVDKICKKVGEEATETVIAAKNKNKDDFIGEISDLIYHCLVLMFNQDVTIDDVDKKLCDRLNINGNKKVFGKRGEY